MSKDDADKDHDVVTSDAAPVPAAVAAKTKSTATEPPPVDDDPTRWVRRAVFLGALVVGWLFIGWQNRFYLSAPVIIVGLGYLAVLSTIYALWRTSVVAVADDVDDEGADSTWGRPTGRRGELEREKRTLLKAIKEAEFDREMGKLSARDAEEMIAVYRLRAIETIKEIDQLEAGSTGTVREQIEREVKARIELDKKVGKRARPAAAERARETAAEPSMPGTLVVVVVVLAMATVANLLTASYVATVFYVVMLIGIMAGNNGVRVFLRGFALLAICLLVVASAPNFEHFTPLAMAVIVGSIVIWIGVIVVLGQSDVRDWMFRKNFNLEAVDLSAPNPTEEKAADSHDPPTSHDSTVAANEAEASENAKAAQ